MLYKNYIWGKIVYVKKGLWGKIMWKKEDLCLLGWEEIIRSLGLFLKCLVIAIYEIQK